MRLFHISEEPDIKLFKPRKPYREDLKGSAPLVWAIDEKRLPNFLTPRDCPRVTYHIPENYIGDVDTSLFSSSSSTHVVAIESKWFKTMSNTTLYLYEFETENFYLQDSIAGYYVSEVEQKPVSVTIISDLYSELFRRNIEFRVLDNLIELSEKIRKTDIHWSMCRMGNAEAKK